MIHVCGDIIIDEDYFCRDLGKSSESNSKNSYEIINENKRLGGVFNIYRTINELGKSCFLYTAICKYAEELLYFERYNNVDFNNIFRIGNGNCTIKRRFIQNENKIFKVNNLSKVNYSELFNINNFFSLKNVLSFEGSVIILSNNATGYFFSEYVEAIRQQIAFYNCQVLVDIQMSQIGYDPIQIKKFCNYENVVLFLNRQEATKLFSSLRGEFGCVDKFLNDKKINKKNLKFILTTLCEYFNCKIIIKLDKFGCCGISNNVVYDFIYDDFSDNDSCGAGDVFISAFAIATNMFCEFKTCLEFANYVSRYYVFNNGNINIVDIFLNSLR